MAGSKSRASEERNRRAREYRKAYGDRVRATEKRSKKKHAERNKRYDAEWHKRNREYKLAKLAKRRKDHPEKARKYRLDNREKIATYRHRRRAMIKGLTVHHTEREWLELKSYYLNGCLRCLKSEPEIELTRDHVIPLSCGGGNGIDNIQPLCLSCNSSKGDAATDYRILWR